MHNFDSFERTVLLTGVKFRWKLFLQRGQFWVAFNTQASAFASSLGLDLDSFRDLIVDVGYRATSLAGVTTALSQPQAVVGNS